MEAFQAGRWHEAEQLFGAAIDIGRNEPLSWVARGISCSEQAKDVLAATDFRYAADIYRTQGADEWATQLTVAANDPSVPNNTPSPCCSPALTRA